ncbi:hypothetical protein OJ996_25785 [Luteolibacter sp. GHJ8]|uniref:Uncharacterized protein n=1 Tax=Luteolibacter rhizosphaerae TaxID=2989719 RepID=A0ABT3GBK2_9BACT|nr:hypothetical protein [Luteolibacter rhizosphaerae]
MDSVTRYKLVLDVGANLDASKDAAAVPRVFIGGDSPADFGLGSLVAFYPESFVSP